MAGDTDDIPGIEWTGLGVNAVVCASTLATAAPCAGVASTDGTDGVEYEMPIQDVCVLEYMV